MFRGRLTKDGRLAQLEFGMNRWIFAQDDDANGPQPIEFDEPIILQTENEVWLDNEVAERILANNRNLLINAEDFCYASMNEEGMIEEIQLTADAEPNFLVAKKLNKKLPFRRDFDGNVFVAKFIVENEAKNTEDWMVA